MPVAAAILSVLAGASAATGNPLAPAAQGLVQCYEPDDLAKTCRSIAGYRLIKDANYANDAAVLISPTDFVVLETSSPVEVKGVAVCGFTHAKDITNGRLRAGGALIPRDRAAPILLQLVTALAAIVDKEICTSYASRDDGLVASVTIDGVDRPELKQRVKWVRPSEGYKVSP